MKKILSLILVLVMCLSLCACNNENDGSTDVDIGSNANNTTVEEKKTIAIEINKENWNTYFEITDSVTWDYNDFNEIDGMWLKKVVKLKPEYDNLIALELESQIAFEVNGVVIDKLLITDYPNKKYSLEPSPCNGLGDGIPKTETVSIFLNEFNQEEVSIYSCHDGYDITDDGEKAIVINVLEQVEVTRAQGVLYLYE